MFSECVTLKLWVQCRFCAGRGGSELALVSDVTKRPCVTRKRKVASPLAPLSLSLKLFLEINMF